MTITQLKPAAGPLEYAPPDQRGDLEIRKALSFLELPIKEIEDTKRAAQNELDLLNAEADKLIAEFWQRITSLSQGYERLMTGGRIFREGFKASGDRVIALDNASPPEHNNERGAAGEPSS